MSLRSTERFLADLRRELRRRGAEDPRFLDEAREHLTDAIDAGRRDGMTEAAAVEAALDRFGPASVLAEQCSRARHRTLDLAVLAAATAIGIAIAYVDTRPSWDDTGVTAMALLGSAGLLGFAAPRRVWMWGAGVGVWTTTAAIVRASDDGAGALLFLVILAFPLAGAYGGLLVRRLLAALG